MQTLLLAVALLSCMLQVRATAEDAIKFPVHEMVRNEAWTEAVEAIPTISPNCGAQGRYSGPPAHRRWRRKS